MTDSDELSVILSSSSEDDEDDDEEMLGPPSSRRGSHRKFYLETSGKNKSRLTSGATSGLLSRTATTISFDPEADYNFDSEEEECKPDEYHSPADICTAVYKKMCRRLGIPPMSSFLKQVNCKLVSLQNIKLKSEEVKAVCTSLVNSTNIEELNFSGNALTSKEMSYIIQLLTANDNIWSLVLVDCSLSCDGINELAKYLKEAKCGIKMLDISSNKLCEKDLQAIVSIIKENQSIQELTMNHNELGQSGKMGEAIGKALAQNHKLQCLDLSWNHIRGHGATGLCKGISKNTEIKTLLLGWNGFGFEGCNAMAHVLAHNKTLRTLDLSCNRIHPPALHELLKGVLKNVTMLSLVIAKNPITVPAATLLLTKIYEKKSCGLKDLDIKGVVVDRHFLGVLDKLQNERVIVVRYDSTTNLERVDDIQYDPKNIFNIDPLRILFFMKEHLRTIDLFMKIDKDESMTLSRSEIKYAFELQGFPISSSAIDEVMGYLDTNGDGEIDLFSLLDWCDTYGEFYKGEKEFRRQVHNDLNKPPEKELAEKMFSQVYKRQGQLSRLSVPHIKFS